MTTYGRLLRLLRVFVWLEAIELLPSIFITSLFYIFLITSACPCYRIVSAVRKLTAKYILIT